MVTNKLIAYFIDDKGQRHEIAEWTPKSNRLYMTSCYIDTASLAEAAKALNDLDDAIKNLEWEERAVNNRPELLTS